MGNSGNDNIIMMGDYNSIAGEEKADSYREIWFGEEK